MQSGGMYAIIGLTSIEKPLLGYRDGSLTRRSPSQTACHCNHSNHLLSNRDLEGTAPALEMEVVHTRLPQLHRLFVYVRSQVDYFQTGHVGSCSLQEMDRTGSRMVWNTATVGEMPEATAV